MSQEMTADTTDEPAPSLDALSDDDFSSHEVNEEFEHFRLAFLKQYGEEVHTSLRTVLGTSFMLSYTPLSLTVKFRFLVTLGHFHTHEVSPALHGTNPKNYESIFSRGFIIPRQGTGVSVVHGSAHGLGVYTANLNAPWLSRDFCSGPKMLVCCVLQSSRVKHVHDAQVVFDEQHVVPLFLAKADSWLPQSRIALPLPNPMHVDSLLDNCQSDALMETLPEMKALGFSAVLLRWHGHTASALRAAGFSITRLRNAGFDICQLACELSETCSCGAKTLRKEGFHAHEVRNTGSSALQLREAGFSLRELSEAGFSFQELRESGFDANAFRVAGIHASEIKKVGFDARELQNAGFDAVQLREAGFDVLTLVESGLSASHLQTAGFTARQFREVGFNVCQLLDTGFTARQVQEAGFGYVHELHETGFKYIHELPPGIVPGQKDMKVALMQLQVCASADFQKKHGIWKVSGNRLAKIKYRDFQTIFADFQVIPP